MEFNATFIVSAISFVIFTILMNAIFYNPLRKIVDERQNFLENTNEDAKTMQKKADAMLKDKEIKLEQTKRDAKKIITGKSDEVNAQKSEIISQARKGAADEISGAKDVLNQNVAQAQSVLDEEVKNLAGEISSKILGKV